MGDDDIMILDNGDLVFLWMGYHASDVEVKLAYKAAQVSFLLFCFQICISLLKYSKFDVKHGNEELEIIGLCCTFEDERAWKAAKVGVKLERSRISTIYKMLPCLGEA